jgi:hypothetical protein
MSNSVGWAMALRPLVLLLVLAAVYPFRIWVERKMKPGKLKSLLLRRVGD